MYAFYKLLFKKADFDWHLINGHFLLKVCCLVILMPSLLSAVGYIGFIDSPKELVYDEELYDSELPNDFKKVNPNIFWSSYFHFIDPGNQDITTTKNGRIWAAIIDTWNIFTKRGTSLVSYRMD